MEPSRADKLKASQDAIKGALGLANDKKSNLKSVKIKIKFGGQAKKMAAVRKKAAAFGASAASGEKGATR